MFLSNVAGYQFVRAQAEVQPPKGGEKPRAIVTPAASQQTFPLFSFVAEFSRPAETDRICEHDPATGGATGGARPRMLPCCFLKTRGAPSRQIVFAELRVSRPQQRRSNDVPNVAICSARRHAERLPNWLRALVRIH